MAGGEATVHEGDSEVVSLYERWRKIQVAWVDGPFQRLRRAGLIVLLAIFYVGPWITWSGRPAVLLDLPNRKFFIGPATFWPQEFVLLAFLLILCAFALFVFTVVAGRVFCGYACPQTVWTLVYVWIEKWIEGDRNQRLRLDRGRWNARKIRKKGLKYLIWGTLALSIGITFQGYFSPIRELLPRLTALDLTGMELFWIPFLTGASFLFHGVLREQVCLHMCPYARFQSVMFDHDTLIVSYDSERGEPRGARRRSADPAEKGLGSCVDCRLCVNVCPTGIDIREGLQYQCIGCAACIDACNGVMAKLDYAPDLIRYSSQHRDQHDSRRVVRPRLVGYAAVLLAMMGTLTAVVASRVPLAVDIIRDRNRLYRERYDGVVENVYTLRIMNREQVDRRYRVDAEGSVPFEFSGPSVVDVAAGEQRNVPVSLFAQGDEAAAVNSDVSFRIETVDDPHYAVSEESRFIRPRRRPRPAPGADG